MGKLYLGTQEVTLAVYDKADSAGLPRVYVKGRSFPSHHDVIGL